MSTVDPDARATWDLPIPYQVPEGASLVAWTAMRSWTVPPVGAFVCPECAFFAVRTGGTYFDGVVVHRDNTHHVLELSALGERTDG